MKIIVSHDIDHISWSEHILRDLFIPKWLIRNSAWLLSGHVSWHLFRKRVQAITSERIHNLPELINFDHTHNVPSTFFLGVANALNMSYPLSMARDMTAYIREQGFDVGTHGVAFQVKENILQEYERFKKFMPDGESFGVRNHYLRRDDQTLAFQAEVGYLFDSSEYGLQPPYMINGIWEFPVCLMDSFLIPDYDSSDFLMLQHSSIDIIQKAEQMKFPYFTLLFHDDFYSDLYPNHKEWYEWIIPWLMERFEFSSFRLAIECSLKVQNYDRKKV